MFISLLLQAVPNLSRQPYWYEIVAGILAIPVLIISAAYSYVLIKKTRIESKKFQIESEKLRLESQKVELEIKEKQQSLDVSEVEPEIKSENQANQAIENLVEPINEGRNIQYIILRFILLFLVLRGWALVSVIADILAEMFTDISAWFSSEYIALPIIAIGGLISALPVLGAVVTTIIIGIPLFKDVNKIVGSKYIDNWFEKQITEWNRISKELEEKREKDNASKEK